MQLEHPLSEGEGRPEASFLTVQDEMASKLIAIRQGKQAGKSEPCGGDVGGGGVSSGKARPSQRHVMNSWTGSGGSGHPPCRAQREESSSWKENSGCEHPSSGGQREGSSSRKESSGCEHPSSGVQKGGGKRPSGVVLRTGSSRGKWGSPDRRGDCGASEHPSGGEGKKESSTLGGGGVVCVTVLAPREGGSPCPAGKDSEAARTPSLGAVREHFLISRSGLCNWRQAYGHNSDATSVRNLRALANVSVLDAGSPSPVAHARGRSKTHH